MPPEELAVWVLGQAFDRLVDARALVAGEILRRVALEFGGFDLAFRTWGDTKVARVRIGWIAIGPVKCDDDWELY